MASNFAPITNAQKWKSLRRSFEAGDVVEVRADGNYYIPSARIEGVEYRINPTVRYCQCPGFARDGVCRHYIRATWDAECWRRRNNGEALIPAPRGFNHDGTRIDAAA